MSQDATKQDVQAFWGSLYDSLYDDIDRDLTRERLLQGLDDLEDMFRFRDFLAVREMPLAELTASRAHATQAKFDLMGDMASGCQALQSDAENLPFADNTFDIVYSNGVLHHTPDTRRAIAEVYRVLKPGGQTVIMLYCKNSWHYWFNIVFCVGVLKGQMFSGQNWVGRATEWGGKNTQSVQNPIARCYTASGVAHLFDAFRGLTMRKGDFFFYLIPKLGRLYRRWQIKRYGVHPGGILVYGEPWPVQSPLELKLGRLVGFSWWISARKPD